MSQPASEAMLNELAELGAATVHEANRQEGAFDAGLKPVDPHQRLCGRAVTVEIDAADNWFIHVALLETKPGDVLVIDAQGYQEAGHWGDVLTVAAQHRGLAGVVIDGAVRDAQDIIDLGFPVFSRGLSIKGTTKRRHGRINVPIRVGGILVSPGDVIVGDRDGLCRVESEHVVDVLDSARRRQAKEDEMRDRLAQGASTLDLLGLSDPRLR